MIPRTRNVRSSTFPRLAALIVLAASLLPSLSSPVAPALAQTPVATTDAPSGGGPAGIPRPDNPYGVNVFLHKEVESWKIEKTLQMVAAANIQWVKQEFPWQEIEFKKGYFFDDKWQKSSWEKYDQIVDLADKYHLNIIARVDHAPGWAQAAPGGTSPIKDNKDLSDFINALIDHYKGRIKYIQVWNEPNLNSEWVAGKAVDPRQYATMLKAVYPAVKALHKDVTLLSAPMAMTVEGPELRGNMNEIDYWNGLYKAGVKGNFDIASANGYGLDQPPDAAPDPKVLNFRRVELIRDVMVKNDDAGTPIWFDEYAWNASPESLSEQEKNFWRHVTPQQQADWTVQGIDYARKNWPWAGVISIWYFRQVGDIPPDKAEYYFAMLNPDFSPQPVYNAVKAAGQKFTGPANQQAGTPVNPPPSETPAVGTRPTTPAVETPSAGAATPGAETTATAIAGTSATPTGTALAAPGTPALTPTAIPATVAGTSNSSPVLYILGALLVLGGLSGLGYYLMKNKQPARK